MDTPIGSLGAIESGSSLVQTAHQDNFFTSFSSKALAAQTIEANTWELGCNVRHGNAAANFFMGISLYVFREPGTVVGFVSDTDDNHGAEWPTTGGGLGRIASFSGSEVISLANDYLVLEFWAHATQGMAMAYDIELRYDGATKVTEGTSNEGSYLETPQNLTFAAAAAPYFPPWRKRPPTQLRM